MATKVYSYGCKHPRDGVELIDSQIWKAHRYYNKLIELHRQQMARAEELRRARFPEYAAAAQAVVDADNAVEAQVEAIRKQNAKARQKRATPDEAAKLKQAKQVLRDARTERKRIRDAIAGDADLQQALHAIYEESAETKRTARAKCATYWGTYLKVEAAVETAIKKTLGPPHFKRWDGDGQVAVQVQKGASWQDLLLGRGKIAGLLKAEPLSCKRTSQRRARPWLFSIRVDSDESKKPIWATVMTYLHRPLPEDAVIMGVSLVRKRLPPHRMSDGTWKPRYDWSLQFTIRTGEEKECASSGLCGIDMGWRLMRDGSLRVAYWADDAGAFGEVRLPADLLARWSKSESIQAIRDRNFNGIIERFADWKAAQTAIPEWMIEAAKFMTKWREKGKLARVVDQWTKPENRINDDAEMLAELQAWREQDVHLWQYEVENAKKAQRIRLDLYRNFVAHLRTKYACIALEDCDWRVMARKKKPDDNTSDAGMREHMRAASVGMLRGLLKNIGAIMVDSKDTTRTCHACGSLEEWDQAKELDHTCSQCSLPWDQDYNAAMNLLARAKVVDETPGTARDPESTAESDVTEQPTEYVGRWTRRKANRSQKDGESDTAA